MKAIRQLARHGVLSSLAAVDAVLSREKLIGEQKIVQVVNFHHLYAREQDPFRKFLKWFKENYQVVSYSEAAERIITGQIDGAYGAITFDDGLKSIVEAGKILAEFDISAAFFVCPSIVGETDPTRLRQFCDQAKMYYESDEFANWSELAELKRLKHEIGNHTFTHPELAAKSIDVVNEEISNAQQVLVRELGDTRHFAWPLGKFNNLGQSAAQALSNFNFSSIASGERGAHILEPMDPNCMTLPCIRRDNLEARWPLSHLRYFLIRNALSPVKREQWWLNGWDISKNTIQK